MKHNLFFLALTLLALAGCSQSDGKMKEGGYEYEIVRKGTGEQIPVNSFVSYNMQITYGDSVMQTISNNLKVEENPTAFGEFNTLVRLFSKMHNGDSFHFYFPLDSFKVRPPGFETGTDPIMYRIGITNVMDETRFQAYADSMQQAEEATRQVVRDRLPEVEAFVKSIFDAYKQGALNSQFLTTDSGVRYILHEEGTGEVPANGQTVSVHYYGMLDADGTMFDNSFSRGAPIEFNLGQGHVIKGWDDAIAKLKKGTKATLFIPAELGYGAAGQPPVIPENAALVFYIELQ